MIAAASMLTFATSASAAVVTLAGGGTEDSCSVTNFTVSIACDGNFTVGNPGGNVGGGDLDGLFVAMGNPIVGWSEIDAIGSVGTGGVQVSTNGLFQIDTTDAASGTWSLINPFAFDATKSYVFTLKGATEQVAYFMDNSIFGGNWSNADLSFTNPGGQFTTPGLSNVRLFEVDVNVIPLPAAGWLLLGGIGGLVALRRKKSA